MTSGTVIAAAVAARHRELASALEAIDPKTPLEASELPGWNRLTNVCHLRYGAQATKRMTRDALVGLPTAFYSRLKIGTEAVHASSWLSREPSRCGAVAYRGLRGSRRAVGSDPP